MRKNECKKCSHCQTEQSKKYIGTLCKNCYNRKRRYGEIDKRDPVLPRIECRNCHRIFYYPSKHGNICTSCRRGSRELKNGNGNTVKNPAYMSYEEKEFCRRILVKSKYGWLNPADIYAMVDVYIEYHFKNEEMDSLGIDRQIVKIIQWMKKLFEKEHV